MFSWYLISVLRRVHCVYNLRELRTSLTQVFWRMQISHSYTSCKHIQISLNIQICINYISTNSKQMRLCNVFAASERQKIKIKGSLSTVINLVVFGMVCMTKPLNNDILGIVTFQIRNAFIVGLLDYHWLSWSTVRTRFFSFTTHRSQIRRFTLFIEQKRWLEFKRHFVVIIFNVLYSFVPVHIWSTILVFRVVSVLKGADHFF